MSEERTISEEIPKIRILTNGKYFTIERLVEIGVYESKGFFNKTTEKVGTKNFWIPVGDENSSKALIEYWSFRYEPVPKRSAKKYYDSLEAAEAAVKVLQRNWEINKSTNWSIVREYEN